MNGAESWPLVNLADCAQIVSGATPKTSDSSFWDGEIDWVTPKDISLLDGEKYLRRAIRKLTKEGLASCSAQTLPANSVLFSSRAPIGLVAVNTIPVATNQGFKSFVPDRTRLDSGYLFHWLRTNRPYLESLGTGATFKELSKAAISRVQIPLPPLEDQKRIAAVLDKADALRRQRQESLELTEKLLQSVFIDMFGDPVANSMDWPILPLGHLGIVQTGNTPPRSNKLNYAQEGIEWIKTDNIIEDRIIVTSAAERISDQGFKVARVAPADSLLVACIAGSEKSIGRAALTDRKVAFNQQINAITPHANTSPLFLYFLIKIGRRQIQEAASKGMKKIINKSTFEALKFIAPPFEQQLRFERIANTLIAQSEHTQAQQRQIDRLFHSLQQRAFRGELDLGRVWLEEDVEDLKQAATDLGHLVNVIMPNTGGGRLPKSFQPSSKIYGKIKDLDVDVKKGELIPWSTDYLRYKIIPSLTAPFTFEALMEKVQQIFDEPLYDDVRDFVFGLLGDGDHPAILRQHFDDRPEAEGGLKAMVLEPVP